MSWAVQAWVEKLDYRSIDIPNSRKPHHQRKGETDEAFRERRQTAAVAAEDTSATATRSCHASSTPTA